AGKDWRPAATHQVLRVRASLIAKARRFFDQRGVMEVDTPTLSAAAVSDVNIASLHTEISA
ncbi:MAG: EF-P lysine aminoacylase GenX, partial [Gammaproteobacteria bacterium]|nr:EF-P lysine aminoacylase GenX [Gammaproteobacteria bacterium]